MQEIRYRISPSQGKALLDISLFDTRGALRERIFHGYSEPGAHVLPLAAGNSLPAGAYVVKLSEGSAAPTAAAGILP
jgi:hypothetical protein